jgi:hypothetical protein
MGASWGFHFRGRGAKSNTRPIGCECGDADCGFVPHHTATLVKYNNRHLRTSIQLMLATASAPHLGSHAITSSNPSQQQREGPNPFGVLLALLTS